MRGLVVADAKPQLSKTSQLMKLPLRLSEAGEINIHTHAPFQYSETLHGDRRRAVRDKMRK